MEQTNGGFDDQRVSVFPKMTAERVLLGIMGLMLLMIAAPEIPFFSPRRTPARESSTRAFMKSIETACAAYEFDFGCYPPDQVTVNGKVLQSSEALAYFLATPFRQSPAMLKDVRATVDVGPYLEITTRHGLDVDGDGAIEIVDVYKEPFEYDNIRDDPNGFTFYGAKDPRQDKKPRNKDSFDIFTPNSSNPGRPLANFKCDWEK